MRGPKGCHRDRGGDRYFLEHNEATVELDEAIWECIET